MSLVSGDYNDSGEEDEPMNTSGDGKRKVEDEPIKDDTTNKKQKQQTKSSLDIPDLPDMFGGTKAPKPSSSTTTTHTSLNSLLARVHTNPNRRNTLAIGFNLTQKGTNVKQISKPQSLFAKSE